MQYIIGSLTTAILFFVFYKITKPHIAELNKTVSITKRQSYTYDMLKPVLPILEILSKPKLKTQATKFTSKINLRVLVVGNKAYWISENALYSADMDGNLVDKESAKVVDTMTMDKVELDKMIFIVDKLTEGMEDDRSNPGHS